MKKLSVEKKSALNWQEIVKTCILPKISRLLGTYICLLTCTVYTIKYCFRSLAGLQRELMGAQTAKGL